jgi:hypothetical protein
MRQIIFCSIVAGIALNSCNSINHADADEPKINSIAPDKGNAGTVVSISGQHFSDNVANNTVSFGGVTAFVTEASNEHLKVNAPTHGPGKVPVVVSVKGKTSNSGMFEYIHPSVPSNYLPEKGKKYVYRVTSASSGDFNVTNKVIGQIDSADFKVERVQSTFPDNVLVQRCYASALGTVFEMTAPQGFYTALTELKNQPGYLRSIVEGFPIRMHIPANAKPNEEVSFTGGPFHFRIESTGSNEGGIISIDMKMYFLYGKVIGYEHVTTKAGTFSNCLKMQYTIQTDEQFNKGSIKTHTVVYTAWYFPGIGVVKDLQTGADGDGWSELTGIQQ